MTMLVKNERLIREDACDAETKKGTYTRRAIKKEELARAR